MLTASPKLKPRSAGVLRGKLSKASLLKPMFERTKLISKTTFLLTVVHLLV